MTLKEAAAILGTSPDNLRQSIARGSLRAKKLGRDWFVTRAEVTRYRKENRRYADNLVTTDDWHSPECIARSKTAFPLCMCEHITRKD